MKIKTVVIAVLVLAVAGGGFYYYKKEEKIKADYEAQISEQLTQINDLQTQVNYTGELTTVYELNQDVHGGTIIDESHLTPVEMPVAMSNNCPQSLEELEGMYYLFDIQEGQILSYNQMMDFEVTDNMRELDIQCTEIPIGLEVGDYVDINIEFTMGQNFAGITHKRVLAINENILKLVVDPKDVYVYSSMKVDQALYSGTKIYAVKYVEGTAQLTNSDYYPVRLETMTTLLQDPNIDMDFSSLSTADRDILEAQLNTDDDAIKELMSDVNTAKSSLESNYGAARRKYDAAVEKAAKDKQKAEEKAAKEAAKQAAKEAQMAAKEDKATEGAE